MHKMHVQAQLCLTLSDTMDRRMPGFPVCHQPGACSYSFPSRWWCHPTISSSYPLLLPPSIFPSIRVFTSESVLCIRWPKYRSFSISPSNEYSGLISFRMDWLNLLAVQGTLKSLLQHHSWKASVLDLSSLSHLARWQVKRLRSQILRRKNLKPRRLMLSTRLKGWKWWR